MFYLKVRVLWSTIDSKGVSHTSNILSINAKGPYVDRTEVRDLRNGTYSLNYRASKAGEYIISVYCKNVPLNGRYDGLFSLPFVDVTLYPRNHLNSQRLSPAPIVC